MGAYFLNINPCQLLLFKPLQRRLIIARSINFLSQTRQTDSDNPSPETSTIVRGDPSLTKTQPATPSTTTSLSTHWKIHRSVTPTHGNRTFSTSSRQCKALRTKIILHDKRICSSCGYVSPDPEGPSMTIEYKDGNTSNNDPINVKLHCPPCEAIRGSGYATFAGLRTPVIISESTMDQAVIVRRTREMFEKTGVIPHPKLIDPSMQPVHFDSTVLSHTNRMPVTPWKGLPQEFRGFFTKDSSGLFRDPMLTRNPDTVEPSDDSTEELSNESDQNAAVISWHEADLPWVTYSEELHESSQVFFESWPPSKTSTTQAPWICVYNRPSAKSEDKSPDLIGLSSAWNKICVKGQTTLADVDELAERFNFFSGKWLVFVSSDKVDNLWEKIAKSTLAGTLGNGATVSAHNERDPEHVICVCSADYRSVSEVTRLREELRRLGVKRRIAYKPDIYTHCGIYMGNRWGIPASLYQD